MSKKMRMMRKNEMTFGEGIEEYLLDCKAHNLWEGTLKHYRDSAKQIMKYVDGNILPWPYHYVYAAAYRA